MKDKSDKKEYWDDLTRLMLSQNLAVLATHNQGQPYTSLVAFAGSEDMKTLYFVTGLATRKYNNITNDPRAAMMIDNRSNDPSDIAEAMAVTATGKVEMVSDNELAMLETSYLEKHPHLSDFVKAPSTRLIRLNVDCYYLVSRFQNVVELHMR